ncbi:MAG: hypothetical protein GY822_32065 [Deltaproteobacteria bacterium]|nr:hypothetical protein [Deltaproteobacteria bacterium]
MPKKITAKKQGNTPPTKAKISETFLTFAKPLLDLANSTAKIPSAADLELMLGIATTIWNVAAVDGWNETEEHTEELTRLTKGFPDGLVSIGRAMIQSRTKEFGKFPWAISEMSVHDDGKGGFVLQAEARMPFH